MKYRDLFNVRLLAKTSKKGADRLALHVGITKIIIALGLVIAINNLIN